MTRYFYCDGALAVFQPYTLQISDWMVYGYLYAAKGVQAWKPYGIG